MRTAKLVGVALLLCAVLVPPAHAEEVRCGGLIVKLLGTDGHDDLIPEVIPPNTVSLQDVIHGLAGSDVIHAEFAYDGDDVRICGGSGSDLINGSHTDESTWGGHNRDSIRGDLGRDNLYGGGGADTIRAYEVNDSGEAVDDLTDNVVGGAGTDVCYVNPDDTWSGCETVVKVAYSPISS